MQGRIIEECILVDKETHGIVHMIIKKKKSSLRKLPDTVLYSGKWQQEWNGVPIHEFITSARRLYTYSQVLLGRQYTSSPWPSLLKNDGKLSQG